MKKNYLLLLLLLLFPLSAKAEGTMTVTCDAQEAYERSIVNCEVKIFDSEVSSGAGKFIISNGSIGNVTKEKCAIGDVDEEGFTCVDDITPNSMTLVRFQVLTGGNTPTTIGITDTEVVGKNFSQSSPEVTPAVIMPKPYHVTLDQQGATTPGTTSVDVFRYQSFPTVTVPKRIYTVTFNYNASGLGETTAPFVYNFAGYYDSLSDDAVKYINANGTSAKDYDYSEDKTLYANWGEGAIILPTPTRGNYIFDGWYTAATNGTKVGNGGTAYTPTSNKTLYAHWKEAITSETYEVKEAKLYAKPTLKEYKQSELESKVVSAVTIEIYNSDNQKISSTDRVGTGYKIKASDVYYDVIVLGDLTGDGQISLGDVSALYNHYRGNKSLKGLYLEAGKLTGKDNISLGDVSKLYNFYRGNSSL